MSIYKVTKTLTGSYVVKFQCPHCKAALQEELTKAGDNDNCPDCKATFQIPGLKERSELEAKIAERAEKARFAKQKKEQAAIEHAEKLRLEDERLEQYERERIEKLKKRQTIHHSPQVPQPIPESFESLAQRIELIRHRDAWKSVRNAIAGVLLIIGAALMAVGAPNDQYFGASDTIFKQILEHVVDGQRGTQHVAAGTLFLLGVARLISC